MSMIKNHVYKCMDCNREGVTIKFNGVPQCRWCGSRSIWPVSSWRTNPVPTRVRVPFGQWNIIPKGEVLYGKNF